MSFHFYIFYDYIYKYCLHENGVRYNYVYVPPVEESLQVSSISLTPVTRV